MPRLDLVFVLGIGSVTVPKPSRTTSGKIIKSFSKIILWHCTNKLLDTQFTPWRQAIIIIIHWLVHLTAQLTQCQWQSQWVNDSCRVDIALLVKLSQPGGPVYMPSITLCHYHALTKVYTFTNNKHGNIKHTLRQYLGVLPASITRLPPLSPTLHFGLDAQSDAEVT